MTHLPPPVKLRIFLVACSAWVLAAAWLVGCVAMAAPLRMGASAALAVLLIGVAVWFVKHDMEMDAIRARASRPGGSAKDKDWELGEA